LRPRIPDSNRKKAKAPLWDAIVGSIKNPDSNTVSDPLGLSADGVQHVSMFRPRDCGHILENERRGLQIANNPHEVFEKIPLFRSRAIPLSNIRKRLAWCAASYDRNFTYIGLRNLEQFRRLGGTNITATRIRKGPLAVQSNCAPAVRIDLHIRRSFISGSL
jgi:hypothetical protein